MQSVPLPTNTLYIGEINGAYAEPSVLRDGRPDFPAIGPLFLTMPDNAYWTLGTTAGKAWSAGLRLKKAG